MFYYLSFLRPPPTQIPLGIGFSITPQIANDLRTELFPEAQDIYYAWCPSAPPAASASSPIQITKPTKLTTWRTANAYREITIQPPQSVREGQTYRLVLTAHPQGFPHIINLGGKAVGERPFPVVSMPIMFSSGKKSPSTGKQEQVERLYRISTNPAEQLFLTINEKTTFDLDKKIWDSGIGLSSWLVELASPSLNEDLLVSTWAHRLRSLLFSHAKCDIVELGTGTGVVSLTLGVLRSMTQGSNAEGQIIATDLGRSLRCVPAEAAFLKRETLESAMPSLEQNISANRKLFRSTSARPQAVVLDWDQTTLPAVVSEVRGGFNLIVMADVTYNTTSFPSLVRTLDSLLHLGDNQGDGRSPMILMGYKERHEAERTLWEMVKSIGVNLEKIGERPGAGGPPVEIWAAQLERS